MTVQPIKACGLGLALLALLGGSPALADLQLRVGLYQNLPKVGWTEDGRPAGIFVDLLDEIAEKEHWTIQYVPGTWAEGLDRLAAGEIDLMPDVAITPEREEQFAFHREAALSSWLQIFARRGSGIRTLVDLEQTRIAVLDRSIQHHALQRLADSFDLTVTFHGFPDYDSAFAALLDGSIDAVIAHRFYRIGHLRDAPVEDTGIIFHPTRLFFAAPLSGNRAVLDTLDRHLADMKQDHTSVYYQSFRKWTEEEVRFRLPAWLKAAGAVTLAGGLAFLLWSLALRHQVGIRTRELNRRNEENARLYNMVRRRAEELEQRVTERTTSLQQLASRQQALARIELAINQPHELRAVLDQITRQVTDLLPASGGASVILWDEVNDRFDCSASTVPDQPPGEMCHRIRTEGGATRWIMEHRKPFVVPDIREDPFRANRMLEEYRLQAYAGLPLLAGGQVLGVLYALSLELRDYSRDDLEFLEAMAARAATAILKVRLYQELAAEKDRAESADHLKSAFLATMSHELRTPLNSIIGFTGILLQGLAGPLNDEQRKQLGIVRDSARHLLALINDVLDISKIEAGQLNVAREPFDLRASIARVDGMVRPLAEKKSLALRTDLATEIGEWTGDARRVEQILLNLLNNAVKFTERGEVALRGRFDGDRLVLDVSDTGIGIRPEDIEQLFQPFRQVDSGLSRRHEGTGLGLAICRRLAALMGGDIAVQSEPGRGSVFTLSLPASGAPPP